MNITAEISTKDRYDTLILALQSIAAQTLPPKHVIIFDDGQQADLRKISSYRSIFQIFDRKNIKWEVIFGAKKGQVLNHQRAIEMAKTPFIFRCDDDNILEANVLETLSRHMDDPRVGAAAGIVSHLDGFLPNDATSALIEDSLFKYAIQFSRLNGVMDVQHLYSTFLFRKTAATHGYPLNLSTVGHREESIFTHEIYRNKWKLMVAGNAIIWHLKNPSGGIRSFNNHSLWQHDEEIYLGKLKEWGVRPKEYFLCYLDNGIGDHYVFKSILPEIRKRHPQKKIIIGACYPNVYFDEPDVEGVS